MKHWGAHKTIGIASACVTLVLAGTIAWLLNKQPSTNCGAEAPADSNVHTIRPTKVVVEPWQGRHQVYGIFMVHNRYRDVRRYSAIISIQGFDGEFTPGRSPENEYPEDVVAEPGHYVKRGYVPTRVALWFLFTGQFGDLRAPCNWALVFIEQSPAMRGDL